MVLRVAADRRMLGCLANLGRGAEIMSCRAISHHRPGVTVVSALVFVSLAIPVHARAGGAAINLRYYEIGQSENGLVVGGTDAADSISIEPRDDNMLFVWANRPMILADETGTCVRVSDQEVACPNTLEELRAELGEGDDRLWYFNSAPFGYADFWLGPGQDKFILFSGARSPVSVYGDAGDDLVTDHGYSSQQTTKFWGGAGADTSVGANWVQGGMGNDVLRARGERVPSALFGGAGVDVIVGRGGDDDLRGGPGRDRIRDRGGDDVIYGGRDADRIASDDGGRDDINCGGGFDRVSRDWRDAVHRCEAIN